ncbi:MAG: hypothetical protein WC762_08140 [Methylobacter sp.]|jgi:hypothetical protein
MPFFIALSLALSFTVQTASPLQHILISPFFIYTGMALAMLSIFKILSRKTPAKIWYDIFASSMLLVWFAYWKPIFNEDSPIFFLYPLYFAFITAFVSLFFIGQRHTIDYETLRQMRYFSDKSRLQPWILMLCVIASLGLQEHFLLYPITMTLFILRFALSSCLEANNRP